MEEMFPKIMQLLGGMGSEVDGLGGGQPSQAPPQGMPPQQGSPDPRQVTGTPGQEGASDTGPEEGVLDALLSGGSVDVQGTLDFSFIPEEVRSAFQEVVGNFGGPQDQQESDPEDSQEGPEVGPPDEEDNAEAPEEEALPQEVPPPQSAKPVAPKSKEATKKK